MVIAVNARVLSGNNFNASALIRCIALLAEMHQAHRFVVISSSNIKAETPAISNLEYLLLPQQSTNPLLLKYWYSYALPAAVRKLRADVLISADGMGALRIKIPQCLLVSDLQYLSHPEWYSKKYVRFIQSAGATVINKATQIIAGSEALKNNIAVHYAASAEKIAVWRPCLSIKGKPIILTNREAIKEQFSQGREYFLFSGWIHTGANLINLLKAFSLFKKRQKSDMQLILASPTAIEYAAFADSLRLYKFRSEVHLLDNMDDNILQQLTASAYAVVNLSPLHSELQQLHNAMQNNIPVVACESAAAKEILGEAALYANANNPAGIAAHLMLLYKDENGRKELINKAGTYMTEISQEQSAGQLWQIILDTIARA